MWRETRPQVKQTVLISSCKPHQLVNIIASQTSNLIFRTFIMAFMNQEKKKVIHSKLKEVMPKGWKFTTGVENHSTIVLNINAAPVDLLALLGGSEYGHIQVNHFWVVQRLRDIGLSSLAEQFEKIIEALNHGNYDNSDSQTDYYDVGHFISINIGRWNRPFVITS